MQKFTISAEALNSAFSKLSQAISTRPTLPALSNMVCKVSEDSIELITSDLELTIHQKLECKTEDHPFELLLPFQFVSKVVALNKKSALAFSIEKKSVKIIGANDVYEIKHLDKIEDYPKLPEIPKKNKVVLDPAFIHWLKAATETVHKDESKVFSKVLLEMRPERMTLASSDGSFMVFCFELQGQSPVEDDLLISSKIIKALQGFEITTISWTSKMIGFESGNQTVVATRPDDKYKDWRKIIPEGFTSNITVDRKELISALEKCCLNEDPFKTTTLFLKGKSNEGMKFSATDTKNGIDINVDVPGMYDGTVESLYFNAEKMLKLVHQVEFPDIELAIHDATRPMLFRTPEDKAYLGLLMPTHNK